MSQPKIRIQLKDEKGLIKSSSLLNGQNGKPNSEPRRVKAASLVKPAEETGGQILEMPTVFRSPLFRDEPEEKEGVGEPASSGKAAAHHVESPLFPGIFSPMEHREEDWSHRTLQGTREAWDESPIYEEPKEAGKRPGSALLGWKRGQKRRRWIFSGRRESWKFIGATAGAIALGSLFGYLLLTLMLSNGWLDREISNPQVLDEPLSGVQAPAQTEVIPAEEVEFDPALAGEDAIQAGSLLVSDRVFYAIQGGAFQDAASGEAAAAQLDQEGFPALLLQDEVSRLFMGIAYKKQDALNLAGYYQNQGKEIYLKEYRVPGGTIAVPGADKEAMQLLNDFFTHGTYLLEKTASWSGSGVTGTVNIQPNDWKAFKDTHRQFLEEAQKVMSFLPEQQKQWIDAMSANMNQAVSGLVEYLEDPQMSFLLQSQDALLQYFNGYRELLDSLGIPVRGR